MNRATLGQKMSSLSLYGIYHNYETKKFPRLLDDENVPMEDKNKIRELLKKPWNPYIRSALNPWNIFSRFKNGVPACQLTGVLWKYILNK